MPKNPRTFWESPWITLCLSAIIRYQNPQFKRNQRNVSLWGPKIQKAPFNAAAEALSFLLQLLDGSFFRRTASGFPRHCGVTLVAPPGDWVFFRKVATFLMLLDTNMEKYASCQPLSILALVVWPHQKQPRLLPARTLQPRCSGMFFHWAGIQTPDSQTLPIHANRVQELKENKVLSDFLSLRRYGISMNKFW